MSQDETPKPGSRPRRTCRPTTCC